MMDRTYLVRLKNYTRPAAEGEDCDVGPNLTPDYVEER